MILEVFLKHTPSNHFKMPPFSCPDCGANILVESGKVSNDGDCDVFMVHRANVIVPNRGVRRGRDELEVENLKVHMENEALKFKLAELEFRTDQPKRRKFWRF